MKRLLLPMVFFILLAGCAPGTASTTPAAEANPTSSPAPASPVPADTATVLPTSLPIDPALYEGWWTYSNSTYGFSLMLPEDWAAEEETGSDSPLNGHLVNFRPATGDENIRLTFRRQGEDTLLWPTGVGQGEFIPQGSIQVDGEPAQRVTLVCPSGEVTAIWYHQAEGQANILRDDLEFSFIYSAGAHCEAGKTLSGKMQQVGDLIIASLKLQRTLLQ